MSNRVLPHCPGSCLLVRHLAARLDIMPPSQTESEGQDGKVTCKGCALGYQDVPGL